MIKFTDLKQIHIEISNNCQASCPMCSRNIHGGLDNPWLPISNWTLEQYKNVFTAEVLNQVDSIFFCGNYGDPCMNKDLLEMCRYSRITSPKLNIRIHTNGGIQNETWWTILAEVLGENSTVVFAIDGLEDTNHIYRIGVNYSKLMKNVRAFISAGGKADWAFIEFKHNQHQKETCKKLSEEMGFRFFSHKQSNRFIDSENFPVYDKSGKTIYHLEPSTENKIVFIDRKVIENYKKIVQESKIDCFAKNNFEVYIDAFGHLFPCCFIGLIPYNYFENNTSVSHIRKEMLDQYHAYVNDFGGIDNINCNKKPIREIIDSESYQLLWDKYWGKEKLIVCARSCGVNDISKPVDQFINETQ